MTTLVPQSPKPPHRACANMQRLPTTTDHYPQQQLAFLRLVSQSSRAPANRRRPSHSATSNRETVENVREHPSQAPNSDTSTRKHLQTFQRATCGLRVAETRALH